MRCSKCLSHMSQKNGVFVCASCGETAEFRNEDGSLAVFERARPQGRLNVALAAFLVVLLAGGGLGSWLLLRDRFAAPGLQGGPAPERAQPAPQLRTAAAGRFDPGLRAGLIASFGVPGEDAVSGLALLEGARIGVLLRAEGAEPALFFVSVDGTNELGVRRLPVEGALKAASLAAGPGELPAALISDDSGSRLFGLGARGEILWERAWPGLAGGTGAAFAADGEGVLVLAPGEAPGARIAAMVGPGGTLVWQRTLPAGAGAGGWAALGPGAAWLAFPGADGAGLHLARLSRAGESEMDIIAEEDPARVGGLQAGPDGGARLLVTGPVPRLIAFGPDGRRLWDTEIRSAVLHDAIALLAAPNGEALVVSAYALADVQTDLAIARIGAFGARVSETVIRLPPGTRLGAATPLTPGNVLIAGAAAEATSAPRDAFLLAVPVSGAVAAGPPAPLPAGRGALTSAPSPGLPTPAPAPAAAAPSQAAPAEASVACQFTCEADGEAVVLTQMVFARDAGTPAGLSDIQAVLCRANGAAPQTRVPPVCEAAP